MLHPVPNRAIFGAIFPAPAAIESTPKNSLGRNLARCVSQRRRRQVCRWNVRIWNVDVRRCSPLIRSRDKFILAYGSKRAVSSFLNVASISACSTDPIAGAWRQAGGIGSRGRATSEVALGLAIGFGN